MCHFQRHLVHQLLTRAAYSKPLSLLKASLDSSENRKALKLGNSDILGNFKMASSRLVVQKQKGIHKGWNSDCRQRHEILVPAAGDLRAAMCAGSPYGGQDLSAADPRARNQSMCQRMKGVTLETLLSLLLRCSSGAWIPSLNSAAQT